MRLAALIALVLAFGIPLVIAVYWLMWKLWLFVLPAVYPSGPEGLTHPSFGLFAGLWFLLSLVFGLIRGSK